MASEIDMLADCLLGTRTEGRRRFARKGPARAKFEAMFVVVDVDDADVGLVVNFSRLEPKKRMDRA